MDIGLAVAVAFNRTDGFESSRGIRWTSPVHAPFADNPLRPRSDGRSHHRGDCRGTTGIGFRIQDSDGLRLYENWGPGRNPLFHN